MNFWLMKNEPEDYDIDDLARDKTEPWDGIRNYQVRNMIRDETDSYTHLTLPTTPYV